MARPPGTDKKSSAELLSELHASHTKHANNVPLLIKRLNTEKESQVCCLGTDVRRACGRGFSEGGWGLVGVTAGSDGLCFAVALGPHASQRQPRIPCSGELSWMGCWSTFSHDWMTGP